jgi:hypothetical protein
VRRPGEIRSFQGGSTRVGRACLAIALFVSMPAAGDDGFAPAATFVPSVFEGVSPVVGSIVIQNDNVFDLDNPEEDGLFYRLANKAHIKTRPDVIYQQLLFTEGEALSKNAVDESERILRSNRYLQDASIAAAPQEDGTVDVIVNTIDSWTLVPRFSLSRSGGENSSGIGLKEMNLFGTGIELEALYKSNVDRDSMIFKYLDRNLFDSWYSLAAIYAVNSDGQTKFLDLNMPFYSLDSRNAHGFSLLDNDQVDSLYENGEIMGQFRHEAQTFDVFRGWSKGLQDGWTKRFKFGVAYDDHQFSELIDEPVPPDLVPENRKLVYPYIGFELLENEYEKTKNVEQINRTEDRFLGTRISARLGYAASAFGSDRDAWIVDAGAQTAFGSTDKTSLYLSSAIAARIEDSGVQNATLVAGARYYRRQSDHRLFYASLGGTIGHNLDGDNQLLLGGDNGLRGYPLRYRSGDKSVLLTLEQRYFTDWYPFRLFRVGGAVFFDAGRTWNNRFPSAQNDGVLRDIGFGLRLANARSGQNRMTHIDVAFPLDGDHSIKNAQLVIETRKSF